MHCYLNKNAMKLGRCCLITCAMVASVILLGILGLFIALQFVGYPYHASCKIDWTFSKGCDEVKSEIVSQIRSWQGDNCPTLESSCAKRGLNSGFTSCTAMPCGQRCLYNYTRTEGDKVFANHLTPVKRYRDDLTFEFAAAGNQCKVEGFSTSSVWYAISDQGTNYCNLRNLVDGAGLSSENGFEEDTSTSVCTQYDAIDCGRF